MSHRPVCVKCETEMRPETNDTTVVEMAWFGPYKVWLADVWKCPGCGVEIVAGFGARPVREDHYADDFARWLDEFLSTSRRIVNDFERPTIRVTEAP